MSTGVLARPPRRARITFSSLDDVVPLRVRGEGGSFPALPRDDGFVARFLDWCIREGIESYALGGHAGRGDVLKFFRREDIPKIKAWLRENGAKESDRTTWSRRR